MKQERSIPLTPSDLKEGHIEMCAEILQGKVTWETDEHYGSNNIPIFRSTIDNTVIYPFSPFDVTGHAWLLRDKICNKRNYSIDIISTPNFPFTQNVNTSTIKKNIVFLYKFSSKFSWQLLQLYQDQDGKVSPPFLISCAALYAHFDEIDYKEIEPKLVPKDELAGLYDNDYF